MFTLRNAAANVARMGTRQVRTMSQMFARTTTFILAKPEQKPEMDAILKEYLESTTYKMEGNAGYVFCQRMLVAMFTISSHMKNDYQSFLLFALQHLIY